MSDHSFNPFMAKKYGVNASILINNAIFWTRTNAANESNYHDGRYWFYGTPEYFSNFFIYLSPRQIQYALNKLITKGVLIKGNYNKKGYDQTNWYSLSDQVLLELNLDKTCLKPSAGLIEQNCPMDKTKLSDGLNKIVRPIPDTKPDTKPDNNILSSTKDTQKKYKASDYEKDVRFMRFYNNYPIKKKGAHAYKMWLRLNPSDETLERMLNDIQTRLTQDSNWLDGYIPHPGTYLNPECPVYKDEIFNREKIKHEAKKAKDTQRQEADKKAAEERALASQRAADIARENDRNKKSDANAFKTVQNQGQPRRFKDILKGHSRDALASS
jgi:hypothetical protein